MNTLQVYLEALSRIHPELDVCRLLQEQIDKGLVRLQSVWIDGRTRTVVLRSGGMMPEVAPNRGNLISDILGKQPLQLNQEYLDLVKTRWPKELDYLKVFFTHKGWFFQEWNRLQGRWYPQGSQSHIGHPAWRACIDFGHQYPCTEKQLREQVGEFTEIRDLLNEIPNKKWWVRVRQRIALEEVRRSGTTGYIHYVDGRTDGLYHLSAWTGDKRGLDSTLFEGERPANIISQGLEISVESAKDMVTPMIYGAGSEKLGLAYLGLGKSNNPELDWMSSKHELKDLNFEQATAVGKEIAGGALYIFGQLYPHVVRGIGKIRNQVDKINKAGLEVTLDCNGIPVTPRVEWKDPDAVKINIKLWQDGRPTKGSWFPLMMRQKAMAFLPLATHFWEAEHVSSIVQNMNGTPYLPIHDAHGVPVTHVDTVQAAWNKAAEEILKRGPNPMQQILGHSFFNIIDINWKEAHHLR